MQASIDDHAYLAQALRLAERGLGLTQPNPTVGCVLVKGGEVVGEGWTAPVGGPHAERVALAAAGPRARGATAYVTLEPCSHHGRTPPCTEALIEAGVARVVCPMLDPNPLVTGDGVARLKAAGIEVEVGPLAAAAEAVNRGFFARMRRGRPWVRVKLAASLDGRTALEDGRSRWITGPVARRDVHRWRARSSAVVTGIGTVLADDPGLDARLDAPPGADSARAAVRQPLRVILDSRLRVPATAKTLGLGGDVLIFAGRAAPEPGAALLATGARIERVAAEPHCDLGAVLARLAALECNDVWVEAGPKLSGALLAAGLVDELVLYLAPKLLGDRGLGMFALGPLDSLDAHGLVIDEVRRLGDDLRICARPSTVTAPATGA
jgi:diaminohydroxyphosphoribosylaminopyrimidine deaminase/5-amino-6-(5-phosphoribosylamino)uracil reductase